MNSYRYRAISANGMIQQGIVEAIDEKSAVRQLRDQGMLPVEIALDAKAWRFRRLLSIEFVWRRGLGAEALAEATHEIATMLKAGQDLDRALRYVVDTANQRAVRDCFDDVRQFVRNGATLASGLERHPSSFPPLYIAVVRAGEAGGRIAESLDRLALLLEQERVMAAAIRAALIYPAMLTVAAVLAISVILTEVLPQFVPLFAEAGATLPASTRILLIVGDFVSSYGLLLLLGLLCVITTVQAAQRNDGFAFVIDQLRLRMPIFGVVHREILAARFTRTLGTLLANGVPLIATLRITASVVQNRVAIRAVRDATIASERGAGLSRTIVASGIFPLRTGQLLRLGEENGELAAMALRAADIHDERARRMMQSRLSLLMPSITITLGAIIAGIVFALLSAMLSLNDLIS